MFSRFPLYILMIIRDLNQCETVVIIKRRNTRVLITKISSNERILFSLLKKHSWHFSFSKWSVETDHTAVSKYGYRVNFIT